MSLSENPAISNPAPTMHWIIPLVTHSLSSFLAWRANTLTLAATIVSFAFAAAISLHLWPIFYGLFALHTIAGTSLTAITRYWSAGSGSRDGQGKTWTRTAAFLISDLLVVAALVPLHEYYLKHRLSTVPWFHLFRARAGCLPIPSRTLTEPIKHTWVDAVGNQLPYGIVVSYAAAMACLFSTSVGSRTTARGLSTLGVVAAGLGALMSALTAAYGLPMCGDDNRDGTHQVAMHVDRSVDWKERTDMTWSSRDRYGTFVVLVTLAGTTVAAFAAQVAAAFQKSEIRTSSRKTSNLSEDKSVSGPGDRKEKALSEHTAGEQEMSKKKQSSVQDGSDIRVRNVTTIQMSTLLMHVLATTAVVLGMAIWSWTGPRVEQTASLLDLP